MGSLGKTEAIFFGAIILSALLLSRLSLMPGSNIADYRPEIISESPGAFDVLGILGIVLAGTAVLIIAKLLGLTLRIFVEAGNFSGAYYFFGIFLGNEIYGIVGGILSIVLRATPYLFFLNAFATISIVSFSVVFGIFLPWKLALLIISSIAVYDSVAVLYTKHMKFLWFAGVLDKIENPKLRETFGIFFPKSGDGLSLIGAGDFALASLLVVSVGKDGGLIAGLFSAGIIFLSFLLLEKMTVESPKSKETGLPGIPPLSLGAVISCVFLLSLGILRP